MTTVERRSVADELGKHVGLALTFAGALLLITRVFIASGRDTGTALAMLRSAGLLPTALGVITTLLPSLAVVVATGTALLALHDLRTGRRPGRGLLAAGVAVVSAAFVPVSGTSLARAAALLVLPVGAVLLQRGSARALWGAATIGILGVHVLTSSALWLPAERIAVTAADGSTVSYVGYVLEESSDALRLLHHEPRLILQLDPEDVTERVVCRLSGTGVDSRDSSVLSAILGAVDLAAPRSGSPDC